MGRKQHTIRKDKPKTTPLQAYYYRFQAKAKAEHRIFIWPTFRHFQAAIPKQDTNTHRLTHKKGTEYNADTIFWVKKKQPQSNSFRVMRRQANAKGLLLEWRSEAEFLRAFPSQPSPSHRLTRINKKKGFTASNLAWIPKKEKKFRPIHKPCQSPDYPSFSLRKTS